MLTEITSAQGLVRLSKESPLQSISAVLLQQFRPIPSQSGLTRKSALLRTWERLGPSPPKAPIQQICRKLILKDPRALDGASSRDELIEFAGLDVSSFCIPSLNNSQIPLDRVQNELLEDQAALFSSGATIAPLDETTLESIWGYRVSSSKQARAYLRQFYQKTLSEEAFRKFNLFSERLQSSKDLSAEESFNQVQSLAPNKTHLHRLSYGNTAISIKTILQALLSRIDLLELNSSNLASDVASVPDINELSTKIKDVLNQHCPKLEIPQLAKIFLPDSSRALPQSVQNTLPNCLTEWVESIMQKGIFSFLSNPYSEEFNFNDQSIEYLIQFLNSGNRDQIVDEICENIQSYVEQGIVSLSDLEYLLVKVLSVANSLPATGQSAINMDGIFSGGFLWFEFTKKEDSTFDVSIYGIGKDLSHLSKSFPLTYEGVPKDILSEDFFKRLSEIEALPDITTFRKEDLFHGLLEVLEAKKQRKTPCKATHTSLLPTEFNMTMSYLFQDDIDSLYPRLKIQTLIDYCKPLYQNGTLVLNPKQKQSLQRILPDLQALADNCGNPREKTLLFEAIKQIKESVQSFAGSNSFPVLQIDFLQSLSDTNSIEGFKKIISKLVGLDTDCVESASPKDKITAWNVLEIIFEHFLGFVQEFFMIALARIFPHFWAIPILSFFHFLLQKILPKQLTTENFSDMKCLISQTTALAFCGPSYFLTLQITHYLLTLFLPQNLLDQYQKILAQLKNQISQALIHLALEIIGEPQLLEMIESQMAQLKQALSEVFSALKKEHRISFENPLLEKDMILAKAPLITTEESLFFHEGKIPSSEEISSPIFLDVPHLSPFMNPSHVKVELQNWRQNFKDLSKQNEVLAIVYFCEQTSKMRIPSVHQCPFWGYVQTNDVIEELSDLHLQFSLLIAKHKELYSSNQSSRTWPFDLCILKDVALSSATFLAIFEYLCRHDSTKYPYRERVGFPLFEQMIQLTRRSMRDYRQASRALILYDYFQGLKPLPSCSEICEEFERASTYSHPIKKYFKKLVQQPDTLEHLRRLGIRTDEMSEENLATILSHELLNPFRKRSPLPHSLRKLFFHASLARILTELCLEKGLGFSSYLQTLVNTLISSKDYQYPEISPSSIVGQTKALLGYPLSFDSPQFFGTYIGENLAIFWQNLGIKKVPLSLRVSIGNHDFPLFNSRLFSLISAHRIFDLTSTRFAWPGRKITTADRTEKTFPFGFINIDNLKTTSQEALVSRSVAFHDRMMDAIFCEPTDRIIRMMHLLKEKPTLLIDPTYLDSGCHSTSKEIYDFYPLLFDIFFSFNHLRAQIDEKPDILKVISEFVQQSLTFIRTCKDPFSYLHFTEFGIFVQLYCEAHLQHSYDHLFPNWEEVLDQTPSLSEKTPEHIKKQHQIDLKLKKALLEIKLASCHFNNFSQEHFLLLCKAFFYIKIHNPSLFNTQNGLIRDLEWYLAGYGKDFLEQNSIKERFFHQLLEFLDLTKMDFSTLAFTKIDDHVYMLGPFKIDLRKEITRVDGIPLIADSLYNDPLVQMIIQKEQIHFSEITPGSFQSSNRKYTIACEGSIFTLLFHHEDRSYIYVENSQLLAICSGLFPINGQVGLWLENTSASQKQLLIKDVESKAIRGQITVDYRNGNYHLIQLEKLIYVDSSHFQNQLSDLHTFCPLDQILCFVDPNNPSILQRLLLRPFNLTFERKEDKMVSKEFPGFFLDPCQTIEKLPVISALVLRNSSGTTKILLPNNQDLMMGLQAKIGTSLSQLALHSFAKRKALLSIDPSKYLSKQIESSSPTMEAVIAALNIVFALPEHFHLQADHKFELSPKEKWFVLQSSLNSIKKIVPLPTKVLNNIPDEAFLLFMGATTDFINYYQHLKMTFAPQSFSKVANVFFNPNTIKDCYTSITLLSSVVPQLVNLLSKSFLKPIGNIPFPKGEGFDLTVSRLLKCFRPSDIRNAFHPAESFSFFSSLSTSSESLAIDHHIPLDPTSIRKNLFRHWLSFYSIAKKDAGEEKQKELRKILHLLKGGWNLSSQQFIDLLLEATTTSTSFPEVEDFLAKYRDELNTIQALSHNPLLKIDPNLKRKQDLPSQNSSESQNVFTLPNYQNTDSYFEYEMENDNFTSDSLSAKFFLLSLYFLSQDMERGQALYESLEADLKIAPFQKDFVKFLHYLAIPSLMNPTVNWIRLKLSALIAERSQLAFPRSSSEEDVSSPPSSLDLLKEDAPQEMVPRQVSAIRIKHTPKKKALKEFLSKILSACRKSWVKKELPKLALEVGYKSLTLLSTYSTAGLLSKLYLSNNLNLSALTTIGAGTVMHLARNIVHRPPLLYREPEVISSSSKKLQEMEENFQAIFTQIHTFLFLLKDTISLAPGIPLLQEDALLSQRDIEAINQSLEDYQRHPPTERVHTTKSSLDLWQGYNLFKSFFDELSDGLEKEKQELLELAKEYIDPQVKWEDLVIFYIQSRSRFPISQSFSTTDFEEAMGILLLKMSWKARCEQTKKALDAYFDGPSEQTLKEVEVSLSTRRSYSFEEFPERFMRALLGIEVFSKQLFRDSQMEVIKKAYEINTNMDSTVVNTCIELCTGGGKTSKVFPTENIKRKLLGKKTLIINIFPTSLIASMQKNLSQTLLPLGQSLTGGIVIDRQTPMDIQTLQTLQTSLIESIEYGNSFCFSKQDLQALELLCIETLIEAGDSKSFEAYQRIPYLQRVLLLLKRYASMVADEAHKTFDPKEELIFPLGSKQVYSTEYFEVISQFLEYYFEVDKTFLEYISKNNLEAYPRDRFQKSCESAARKMGKFFKFPEKEIDAWTDFIMGRSASSIDMQNHAKYEQICLVRGFVTSILPGILKEGPLGIEYGQSKERSVTYAKPMEGRENVKETSTFQNPEEIIMKTVIMYLSQGLSEDQFWQTVKILHEKFEQNLKKGIHPKHIKEYQILNQYQNLGITVESFATSDPKERTRIYESLKNSPPIVLAYIPIGVVPQVHVYPECIRSTAYNFASMVRDISMMTATPHDSKRYPDHNPVFSNTQAKALEGISRVLAKDPLIIEDEGAEQSLASIIQQLQNKTKVKALIDTGAFMRNIPNRKVAQALSERLPHLEGVVFFDNNAQNLDEPFMYTKNGQIQPLDSSNIRAENRIVFYDSVHCYGTDIKIAHKSDVFATIGPDTPFHQLIQGAGRDRRLRDPFSLTHQMFLLVRPSDKDKSFPEIIRNALVQQTTELSSTYVFSYLMRIENEVRRAILEKILRAHPEKAVKLMRKYRSFFVTSLISGVKEKYGAHKENVPIEVFIKSFIRSLLHPLQTGKDFNVEEISLIEKNIHSLSRPPLPKQVPANLVISGQQMQVQINTEQKQEQEQTQEQEQATNILSIHPLAKPVYNPIRWPSNMNPFHFDFREYLPDQASYLDRFRRRFSTFYLCDLLEQSNSNYLQNISSYFSRKIWVSCNFHPPGTQFASLEQRHVYQVIILGQMIDEKLQITSIGCLSQKDAAHWRKMLQAKDFSSNHVAFLYDISTRCIVAGSDFDLEKFRSLSEVQEIETMLHFLNADLPFDNPENLQRWANQKPELFKQAFLEIYKGREHPPKFLKGISLNFLL